MLFKKGGSRKIGGRRYGGTRRRTGGMKYKKKMGGTRRRTGGRRRGRPCKRRRCPPCHMR